MIQEKYKQYFRWGLTAICVVAISIFIAFLFNQFQVINEAWEKVSKILSPIAFGIVMSLLCLPMYNKIRQGLMDILKKRFKKASMAVGISKFVASLVCVAVLLFVVIALIWLLIPELISSIRSMMNSMPQNISHMTELISNYLKNNQDASKSVVNLINTAYDKTNEWLSSSFLPNIDTYMTNVTLGVKSVFNVIFNFFVGLIVMVYLLNIKSTLAAQAKKICYAIFTLKWANIIVEECRYIKQVFLDFLVGKIIDSIIIGILCFICLTIIEMPYTLPISVIVGVTNVIPFFGPFIGAIPCAILLLFISPMRAVQFSIFVFILQQFDGNILGPKILGDRTGLSSFWVLFAILLFGGLYGLVGMIIAVPTFAVIYRLIGRLANVSLHKKELSEDTIDYLRLDKIDEDTKEYISIKDSNNK